MQIEGKIIDVFETWPLQLTVETRDGRLYVGLQLDTTITYHGLPSGASELKAHRWIRIDGEESAPQGFLARSITILTQPSPH
jgi:hypothetical protein